ncbi:MAG: hypothetical protein D6739_06815 [Nitrospirae bacterium]|nr:MAG: hypothetical protein D6739_06815 [Nitrospirota bacterium]
MAEATVKQLIRAGRAVQDARILILGLTFKENVPDLRNSRVVDIITELRDYGVEVFAHEPRADAAEAEEEMGIAVTPLEAVPPVDGIVLAVSHQEYCDLSDEALRRLCRDDGSPVFIDVKTVRDRKALEALGFRYWCL